MWRQRSKTEMPTQRLKGMTFKLSSPGPKPQTPKPKTKGPWADTKISWVPQ